MPVNEIYTDNLRVGDGTSEDSVMAVYGGAYFSNTTIFAGPIHTRGIFETATVNTTTVLTGNVDINILDGVVYYFTQPASSTWTFNVRGNANTSIDGLLSVGESLTLAFGCAQGPQGYVSDKILVDGDFVYPKWQGGATPTSGSNSSVDMYSFTLIKTATRQYTAFASQTRFA